MPEQKIYFLPVILVGFNGFLAYENLCFTNDIRTTITLGDTMLFYYWSPAILDFGAIAIVILARGYPCGFLWVT